MGPETGREIAVDGSTAISLGLQLSPREMGPETDREIAVDGSRDRQGESCRWVQRQTGRQDHRQERNCVEAAVISCQMMREGDRGRRG